MKINNKIYILSRCLVSGLALCAATLANAAIYTSVSSVITSGGNGGYSVSKSANTVTELTGAGATVGTSATGTFFNAVFAFQLPDLGAYSFVSADLKWTGVDGGDAPVIDLFALRTANDNSVVVADFDNTPTGISELLSGVAETGSTGLTNANLNTWLSNNYVAGNYVYFAFRADANPGGIGKRYQIGPSITLDIVPEPTTYALIFGGLTLGFVIIRRHRKA